MKRYPFVLAACLYKVNECRNVFPTAGRILLKTEGFEIFFRKLELHPLKAQ